MPHLFRRTVMAATILLAASGSTFAASDYLLKFDGVEGDSTMKGFEKQIGISSFSWGVSQTASGSASRAGKSCPSDLNLTKNADKATPPLISKAVAGDVSPTAILIGLRGGGSGAPQPYIRLELKNVMVSSYSTSGASGSPAQDALSLRFGSMTVTYFQSNDNGTTTPVSASFQGGC